jgi:recombination DNA repair RAD52 pathway protein
MIEPVRGRLTQAQVERLLRPIRPNRVFHTQGQANVAGWEIRAHMNRMFGFGGWENEIKCLELISEVQGGPQKPDGSPRTGWYVTYRLVMTLRIFDPTGRLVKQTDGVATGSAQNQPDLGEAHDLAVKNADTYALKRCCINLGDQFGLSLYNGGRLSAVVGMTLVGGTSDVEPDVEVDGEGHDPDKVSEGHGLEQPEAAAVAARAEQLAERAAADAPDPRRRKDVDE